MSVVQGIYERVVQADADSLKIRIQGRVDGANPDI
jgi:hypothetical protein